MLCCPGAAQALPRRVQLEEQPGSVRAVQTLQHLEPPGPCRCLDGTQTHGMALRRHQASVPWNAPGVSLQGGGVLLHPGRTCHWGLQTLLRQLGVGSALQASRGRGQGFGWMSCKARSPLTKRNQPPPKSLGERLRKPERHPLPGQGPWESLPRQLPAGPEAGVG